MLLALPGDVLEDIFNLKRKIFSAALFSLLTAVGVDLYKVPLPKPVLNMDTKVGSDLRLPVKDTLKVLFRHVRPSKGC
jgi:hypothetical protein